MSTTSVTLDLSKSQPLPVTLDLSKSQPIGGQNSEDLDKKLHEAYDSRPLWRKVLGLEPSDLTPELQQHLADQKQAATKQIADQLQGVYSGYGEGAKFAAKAAPFMAMPELGAAASGVVGGGIGGTLANMATQGLGSAGIAGLEGASPTGAATAGMLGAAGPLAEKVFPTAVGLSEKGKELYQSALKPRPALAAAQPEKVAQMIETGLQNKIPISQAGLQKLSSLVEDLQDKVSDVIANDPTRPINPVSVAQRIRGTAHTFENQVNPDADLAAINASKAEFLAKHTLNAPYTKVEFRPIDEGAVGAAPAGQGVNKIPIDIPAADAQAEKIGTYQQLRARSYGELKSASIEAQKALARGLKEELASQFPELSSLNAQEGRLLSFEPELERAVARINNHQLFGIGTPLAAAGAKAVTGSNSAAAAVGIFRAVMDDPRVKSRLAIALIHSGVPAVQATSRIASFAKTLAQADASSNSEAPSGQPNGQ